VTTPLPVGFRMVLDPDTKRLDNDTLFGGSPARVMRLTAAGQRAFDGELLTGAISTRTGGLLARRLVDAGIMHPHPPQRPARYDATVIIPVRDRSELLARCLDALGAEWPVLVVDDGSARPELIAEVCAQRGAPLVRREVNGGPAAARNSGLAEVASEIVVFVDSDCVPPPGFVAQLAAHLDDPLVAAVAPRIVAVGSPTSVGRYARACGSLDLGDREARVAPLTRVAYVPTAALVARRAALVDIARDGVVFDTELRYGEDVDLEWRLHEAGWRMRYDPSVTVAHTDPDTWSDLLARRFRYGTSAGPLAVRHPASMAPFVVHPWSALTVAAALARRPLVAAAAFAGSALSLIRTLRRSGVRRDGIVRGCAVAAQQTWLGLGRVTTQFAAPALVAALVAPGRRGRRIAAASLLLGPPLVAWRNRKPDLGLTRFVAAHVADDIAYGAGVWVGAARAHTTVPFRPTVTTRMVRVTAPTVPIKEHS
jgi:mycofactocin system glycosyltransferase